MEAVRSPEALWFGSSTGSYAPGMLCTSGRAAPRCLWSAEVRRRTLRTECASVEHLLEAAHQPRVSPAKRSARRAPLLGRPLLVVVADPRESPWRCGRMV
eukprot:tig00001057_g6693.t1